MSTATHRAWWGAVTTLLGIGLGLTACGHSGPPGTSFDSGTYKVGEDITAGTYVARSPVKGYAPTDCIWAVSRDGVDIKGSTIGAPQRVVTVADGQSITTAKCGVWVRQDIADKNAAEEREALRGNSS